MQQKWIEHILLRALCNPKRHEINEALLADLREEHFSSISYRETFKRILNYYAKKNRILTWKEIIADSAIPEKIRTKLRAQEVKRRKLSDHDQSLILPNKEPEYRSLLDSLFIESKKAQLIEVQNFLTEKLDKSNLTVDDIDKIFFETEGRIDRIKTLSSGVGQMFQLSNKNVKRSLDDFYEKVQNQFFLPTGFKGFDTINVGIPRDSLFILSGKTGTGKSSLATQLAINMKRNGARVANVQLEMSVEMNLYRIASNFLGLPPNEISKEYPKYRKKLLKKFDKFINTDDDSCLDYYIPDADHTIIDVFTALKPSHYDIIIVDYLTLLAELKASSEAAGWSKSTRYAKMFSTNNLCVSCILLQLDDEANRVRYSRGIVEHASNSWMWNESKEDIAELGYITINQKKARNQNDKKFRLKADLACCKFTDYDGEEEPEERRERHSYKDKKKKFDGKEPIEEDIPNEDDI